METVYAWIVVGVAGLGAVWLMLPWRIEVVEGQYAPAYIVALFEGVFRADGNPRPALMALALASLVVVVLFLIVGAVRRVRRGAAGLIRRVRTPLLSFTDGASRNRMDVCCHAVVVGACGRAGRRRAPRH